MDFLVKSTVVMIIFAIIYLFLLNSNILLVTSYVTISLLVVLYLLARFVIRKNIKYCNIANLSVQT
jgi:hypothetical protein